MLLDVQLWEEVYRKASANSAFSGAIVPVRIAGKAQGSPAMAHDAPVHTLTLISLFWVILSSLCVGCSSVLSAILLFLKQTKEKTFHACCYLGSS